MLDSKIVMNNTMDKNINNTSKEVPDKIIIKVDNIIKKRWADYDDDEEINDKEFLDKFYKEISKEKENKTLK